MASDPQTLKEVGVGIDIGQNLVTGIAAIFIPSGAQQLGEALGDIARVIGQAATGKPIPTMVKTVLPNGKIVLASANKPTGQAMVKTVSHTGEIVYMIPTSGLPRGAMPISHDTITKTTIVKSGGSGSGNNSSRRADSDNKDNDSGSYQYADKSTMGSYKKESDSGTSVDTSTPDEGDLNSLPDSDTDTPSFSDIDQITGDTSSNSKGFDVNDSSEVID